jgi:phosphotransferase system HPr-like phosphotransfer protein
MKSEMMCSRELALESGVDIRLRDLIRMVQKAKKFHCGVLIRQADRRIDGKNLADVASLTMRRSEPILIETWGPDAKECLWALCRIATRRIADNPALVSSGPENGA